MAHLTVTLSKDANGNCVQKLNGVATAVVSLDAGDTVTFQSETGGSFLLNFPAANVGSCNSPFRDASGNCQWRFDNSNPNSGPVVGPPSTPFPYGALSINGATCNLSGGPQPLGMRIKP